MAKLAYICPVRMKTGHCGTFTDVYGLGMTMLSLMADDKKPNQILKDLDLIIEDNEYERLNQFLVDNWDIKVLLSLFYFSFILNLNLD